ncbi:uncharacterized protein LOC135377525 isoform X3 [Ornithodoros turicata]|uniref:uncharacterized protein LOC135377525 isoform X3 n=1 Tax=Ornithodoros turicata TaxID=34597 RepID=UPI003139DC54
MQRTCNDEKSNSNCTGGQGLPDIDNSSAAESNCARMRVWEEQNSSSGSSAVDLHHREIGRHLEQIGFSTHPTLH